MNAVIRGRWPMLSFAVKRSRAYWAALLVALGAMGASQSVLAHFLLIYTPEVNLQRAGSVTFKLIFWHPMANGQVMALTQPKAFYYLHKGKRVDLLPALSPIEFTGVANSAPAFEASATFNRVGDYVLVFHQAPFYEASENKFIEQIAKAYVNHAGVPGNWAQALGLATEIVPLTKPTNALAGSTFTGQVLAEGKPVPHADIEVEYLAAEPDMDTNRPKPATVVPPPGGALVIKSDANGYFTFGIPRAGFWGFAALGTGPATVYEGKALSQDAVLWIRAYELK